jgi:hypothetical protein
MMPSGRTIRRALLAAVVVAGGSIVAVNPEAFRSFYLELYPNDPAKRDALEMCFLQDHKFNRLDPDERATCYRHALVPTQSVAGTPLPERPEPNAIDLRRAAAAGSMPRNDIRRIEQNESTLKAQQ